MHITCSFSFTKHFVPEDCSSNIFIYRDWVLTVDPNRLLRECILTLPRACVPNLTHKYLRKFKLLLILLLLLIWLFFFFLLYLSVAFVWSLIL